MPGTFVSTTGIRSTLAERASDYLTRYSGWFIAIVLLMTLLFVPPIFLMPPSGPASQDPGGPVFDLQETVNQRFPPRVHITSFIVEAREGDVLRQELLWELYQNERRLRDSDLGRFLYTGYDADNERSILGLYTMADAVQNLLLLDPSIGVTLETASGQQVKEAVARILENPQGQLLRASLSRDASFETSVVNGHEVKIWSASALSAIVVSDNAMLGGGPLVITLSGDEVTLGKERFNRGVQEILRGSGTAYRLWGIAIDLNLVSEEQGRTAIPYIAATLLLVLVVVGLTLRSVGIAVMTLLGLLMLLVWLKGLSNLVGLNSSLTLDLIVPIAMISLGVDFLIHAVARYREEWRRVVEPRLALRAGFAGVLGALTLAMLSDGIAFLANVTAGIETVIGFGIAAGIAVVSSYIIMGMFLPLIIMRLDQRRLRVSGQPRRLSTTGGEAPVDRPGVGFAASARIPDVVMFLARRFWVVMPVTVAVTIVATYLAFQLEPRLDVKDFFDSDSDFVKGLDKLDQYTDPALAGEPAVLYIQGDLTDATALSALDALLERLSNNENLGRSEDGKVSLYKRTVFQLLARIVNNDYARSQVLADTGVVITDTDGDQIPDGPDQIRASYDYMMEYGVPLNGSTLIYDPIQVREVLYPIGPGVSEQATILMVGVLGSRQQANIGVARQSLEQDLSPLENSPGISFVGITGSPFTREATLKASTRALNTSLPVAVAACLILLILWMRSVRMAVVTIIPIGLVVSWLYAFMYLAGFHLNFVTATIAAVSIGVGIDYSIHMTQRFRQELARQNSPAEALRAAAAGTGVPLAGSAASSVIGFGVMSFAPMPLFSAYGVITAAMIFMAAAAALLVLPSLLLLVAGSETTVEAGGKSKID
ncbi:MAG: MMPL family transporter [Chloroflexi bacterium]|nr:MMPL family transporter [Chloroflexota bacterium]